VAGAEVVRVGVTTGAMVQGSKWRLMKRFSHYSPYHPASLGRETTSLVVLSGPMTAMVPGSAGRGCGTIVGIVYVESLGPRLCKQCSRPFVLILREQLAVAKADTIRHP
jgi:hypothetical protein